MWLLQVLPEGKWKMSHVTSFPLPTMDLAECVVFWSWYWIVIDSQDAGRQSDSDRSEFGRQEAEGHIGNQEGKRPEISFSRRSSQIIRYVFLFITY